MKWNEDQLKELRHWLVENPYFHAIDITGCRYRWNRECCEFQAKRENSMWVQTLLQSEIAAPYKTNYHKEEFEPKYSSKSYERVRYEDVLNDIDKRIWELEHDKN